MDWTLILPIVGGIARNLSGWATNSLADGKIDTYEWGKLFSTILEVGILAFSAAYGLGLDVTSATGLAILGSFLLSSIKKIGKK